MLADNAPRRFSKSFAALITVLACAAPAGGAETVLERKARDARPCSGLENGALKLNRLRSLAIDRASVSIEKNDVSFHLSGRLSCETPESALIQTHAGAQVTATVEGALDKCPELKAQVRLSDLSGGAGAREILELAKPDIEKSLADSLRASLEQQCIQFSAK